jgi:hypothetical protein
MKSRITVLGLLLLAAVAGWFAWRRNRPSSTARKNPAVMIDLTKHDGETIDFSSGRPVIKGTPADRATVAREAEEMREAAESVTFKAAQTPAEPPPASPGK